jgi:hypothetical protein
MCYECHGNGAHGSGDCACASGCCAAGCRGGCTSGGYRKNIDRKGGGEKSGQAVLRLSIPLARLTAALRRLNAEDGVLFNAPPPHCPRSQCAHCRPPAPCGQTYSPFPDKARDPGEVSEVELLQLQDYAWPFEL